MSPQKRAKREAELIRIDAWFGRQLAAWHGPASRQELYVSLFLVFTINLFLSR